MVQNSNCDVINFENLIVMKEEDNKHDGKLDRLSEQKIQEGIRSLLEEKELKIKWREELESNPAVLEYFKGFSNKDPKNDFLDVYLSTKYQSYAHGDMYKEKQEKSRNQWIELAHEHLGYIQQKKMFDLQCIWRAEQITIAGVDMTIDFKIWENDILNCNFIAPITADEVAMYQDFLLSNTNVDHEWFKLYEWQEYNEFKASYLDNEEKEQVDMPDWYEFHNMRTGNGSLLLLPDVRGEKEEFYVNLYRKAFAKTNAPTPHIQDSRPFLSGYNKEQVQFFVKTFEDKETQKKYQYYTEGISGFDDDDVYYTLGCILDADEMIAVEAHDNILEAIKRAYNKYWFRKIAECLPIAYEHYLFNRKMGFRYEPKGDDFYLNLKELIKGKILDAREWNGEERTLDF